MCLSPLRIKPNEHPHGNRRIFFSYYWALSRSAWYKKAGQVTLTPL
jgi:hypothetical protein